MAPTADETSISQHDTALLRIVGSTDPYGAPHGTKGAAWGAVADALASATGHRTTGLQCRSRMQQLLERFDLHRAGRRTSKVISKMSTESLEIMEKALLKIAKDRTDKAQKASALKYVAAQEKEWKAATASNSPGKRAAVSPARGSPASTASQKKARTAAPVPPVSTVEVAVAADAVVVEKPAASPIVLNALGKATVPAKRRKRRGVKSREEKLVMDEVMRKSREDFMNQLRVQTAAKAAAEETGEEVVITTTAMAAPAVERSNGEKTPVDLDLCILRAVNKAMPYTSRDRKLFESRWTMAARRVLGDTKLKFPSTAIRDRCEALVTEFEQAMERGEEFPATASLAEKHRYALLTNIRKALVKYRERLANESVVETIEIDDDQDVVPESPRMSGIDLFQSPSTTALDQSDHGEQDEDDESSPPTEQLPAEPVDATASSTLKHRKRRRESVESADADPAVDDPSIGDHSQDSNTSLDFGGDDDELPASAVPPVLSAVSSASEAAAPTAIVPVVDGGSDTKALIAFMHTQLGEHRRDSDREHDRRTAEQKAHDRQVTGLLELLEKQREDHRNEMMAMLAMINKERDDRRNEFMVTMNLITKMVDAKLPSSQVE